MGVDFAIQYPSAAMEVPMLMTGRLVSRSTVVWTRERCIELANLLTTMSVRAAANEMAKKYGDSRFTHGVVNWQIQPYGGKDKFIAAFIEKK
jgi:hypothetical protein